ncbi:uncharacterized protein LOC125493591 [Beta vulgaris subsp. vulgaris]|uniref:uncharacterized protein LOC125493591 n=1 Tax=Beta vulgaris subsp. vulgaris TaxID=3555 RepID=UPI0020372705|nr:uncharacterized protein LOC125493591 [Beta vulgaris subsp. vulgaris]
MNGKQWHCLFLYGASQYHLRANQWWDLSTLLQSYTNYLIIGDINQLDLYSDKLGGSALIRGWEVILEWKLNLHVLDVPFTGPRYTWTNNRANDNLIMERLDRAYASPAWLSDHPDSIIKNMPITISDHAPILLQTEPTQISGKRPYQIKSWSLRFQEVTYMVTNIWELHIVESSAYVLSRRLALLRNRLKAWSLDRKLFWGINWKKLLERLQHYAGNIDTLQDGVLFTQQHHSLCQETQVAYDY